MGRVSFQKSRIRETKHLSTDADSSTDAIGGWTKAKSAKNNFFLRGDFRPLSNKNVQMLDHFFRIFKNIGHPTSGSGGTKTVKKDQKPKKTEKSEEKNFFFARQF